mgnify:CR=1 FL=1
MNILVIDDDAKLLAEVDDILTRNGHAADCTDNAKDAIQMAKTHHYDFVLVDYRMPKHDGLWFMKNIALPRGTKAVLMSAFVDREVLRQMAEAGISGYVIKPFDEADLLRHINFDRSIA